MYQATLLGMHSITFSVLVAGVILKPFIEYIGPFFGRILGGSHGMDFGLLVFCGINSMPWRRLSGEGPRPQACRSSVREVR
jgi:hypothetical protein